MALRPQALPRLMMGTALGARAGIIGTAGVWTDVTPPFIDLTAGYSQTIVPGNTDDNYGVQDIKVHPFYPNVLYAFANYQGCLISRDFGATWAKQSEKGGPQDRGKNWGASVSLDGVLFSMAGNDFTGSPEGRRTMQISRDGGITFVKSADTGGDPYNVECCPFDPRRAIGAHHDTNHFLETLDGGYTWIDHGTVNAAISHSGVAHYLHNADTVLYRGTDTDNTYRGTKSGPTWTWSQVTDLNNAGHAHGVSQIFYDRVNGAFFLPAGGSSNSGIFKSTDNGQSWTNVYSTEVQTCLAATPSTLYSCYSFPINNGTQAPKFTSAPRNPGTSWATATNPAGMPNGAKSMAVTTDGTRWVIVAGCWCGGIWRYIE